MSPFDQPPSTPPVSFDQPPEGGGRRSRRRTAAVAAASVGLAAAGVVAVAQFASADDSSPLPANAVAQVDEAPPASAPSTMPDARPVGDDQIVIRLGDEEPIVIDLGDLGLPPELADLSELGELGELGDLHDLDFEQIQKCLGGSLFDLDLDAVPASVPPFGGLEVFGGDVTLAGPDGVSVLDFGEGDGSVTITRENGELTITSEGDVDVQEMSEILDGMADEAPAERPLPPLPDFDRVLECLEEAGVGTGG